MRALAVKTALHKQGVLVEPVAGYGAYLPVATNNGQGKYKNQRVEVWLIDDSYQAQDNKTTFAGPCPVVALWSS